VKPNSIKNKLTRMFKSSIYIPVFYIVTGIFLLFSLIVIFQTYVLHLKVESAVVSTDIETIISPVSGYISSIYVSPGETVKQGMPLLKVENLDLERQLQLALLKVEEAKLDQAYYQKLLFNEQQRLHLYKKIGDARLNAAQTLVKISQQDILLAQHIMDKFTLLNKKSFISEMTVEAKRTEYETVQQKLKQAQVHYQIEQISLKAVNKGLYFTGNKVEGIEKDLFARLEATKQKIFLNLQKVKIYGNIIKKLTLQAPFDGKIIQTLKTVGNTIDNTKPILLMERGNTNKNIVAYLTQDEIVHIGSAEQVKIYAPSTGHTYKGKILEINRSDGFIDAVKAQYRWRDFQIDKSALVTIIIQEQDQERFDKEMYSGMPVVVYFVRSLHFFTT
jgi:multidrug resistance efflux pump